MQPAPESFPQQVRRVMGDVRSAVGAVLRELPGDPSRPHEVQKALKLDRKLGWKVSRLVSDADPFAATRFMLAPQALRIFLTAARRKGASDDQIQDVERAARSFDDMIARHAGDRSSFDMLIAGLTPEDRAAADLLHKRLAFQGMSYLLGLQARAHIVALFLNVNPEDNRRVDCVTLSGFVGLRRLREGVPFIVTRLRTVDDDGVDRARARLEPLDPAVDASQGVAVLPEFCAPSDLRLISRAAPGGFTNVELEPAGLGDTAAQTLFVSSVWRGAVSRYRDAHNDTGHSHATVRTPTQTLIMDIVAHRDAFGPIVARSEVYSDVDVGTVLPPTARPLDRLPLTEAAVSLGSGAHALRCPEAPDYERAGQYVFARMGWSADEFEAHRVRVEFPLAPSSVLLSFGLPSAPVDMPR
ncbi:MAG: hypothetical protein KDA32_05845 [Phycisphaerales bacterium]|nr:hypothetical protein [Phycisphaerales bacterium]